jgi:hypothetical protein
MSDSQILNKAISQVVKFDNQLFQRSWNSPKYNYTHSVASTTISSSYYGAEDMQIDVVQYKPITA